MSNVRRRRMVSVFVVVLLVAIMIVIPQLVFAEEGDDENGDSGVTAIEYIPAKEVVYYQGLDTHPGWARSYGDHLIVTMEDGQQKDYVYRSGEGTDRFICDETGDNIWMEGDPPEITYTSDQQTVPWELGTYEEHPGNYVTVTYAQKSCKIPITLKENPVQSISCTPAKPYKLVENVHGWQNGDYFEYDYPGWNIGDTVTIFFKDGTNKTYVDKYVKKLDRNLFVNEDDPEDTLYAWGQYSLENTNDFRGIYLVNEQSAEHPWTLGSDNHVTISCANATCQVPVEIVENDVESIKFTPKNEIVYVENHGGYEEESEYFYEFGMEIQEGDTLEVTYNDGRGTRTYVAQKDGTFVDSTNEDDPLETLYDGEAIMLDGRQEKNPWKLGSDNNAWFKFRGVHDEVPVRIIPTSEAFETAYNAILDVVRTVGNPKNTTDQHEELIQTAVMAVENLSDDERLATYRSFDSTLDEYVEALEALDGVLINEEHFPDEIFRGYVSSKFDKDKNGILSKSEAEAVTEIICRYDDDLDEGTDLKIKDYTGVEYFSNLTKLICGTSVTETLDVTQNQKLEYLTCEQGKLTVLDVSQNPELTYLNCRYTELESLDVSNNLKLQSLLCDYVDLASLDVTQNTELEELFCSGTFSELDITHNTKLRRLKVNNQNLTALDLSNASDLRSLNCANCNLTELNTGELKKLSSVIVSGNQLKELDLKASENLDYIRCQNNKLQKLIIAEQTPLEELNCSNNELSDLNVGNAIQLKRLDCNNNQLMHLPLYDMEQLYYLNCSDNKIKELNIGACKELVNAYENGVYREYEETNHKGYYEKLTEQEEADGVEKAAIYCDINVTINPAPHEWETEPTADKAATCTEEGIQSIHCKTCSERKNIESTPATGHTEETIPAKAATCTETGLTEGTKCSVCGEILKAQETVPAKGHTEETIPAKAATCTETGLTEGTKCSVCGEILKAQETVPAKGHTLTATEATDPTYDTTGNSAYWTCSACGKYFSDAEGKTEIEKDSWVIDKLPPKPSRYLDASDIFWFSNSYTHFGYDDYYISDNDLQKLINNARQIYSEYPDFAQSTVNRIRDEQRKTWAGSCYGMSAVTILDKQDSIGFNENFDPPAATMNEVRSPSENASVKSAINYYFLGQMIPYLRVKNSERYSKTSDNWNDGLKKLVSMSQNGKPILFSYFWTAADGYTYGHAIVIKGYEKSSDGEHHIIAYDNRLPLRDMIINVSSDYSSCVVNGNENANSIEYIQDMSAFDAIDIDGPDNKYQSDPNDNLTGSGSVETASKPEGTNITVRASGKVSIENAEGQKLDIEDGQSSGDMAVLDSSLIVTSTDTGEDGSMLSFTVKGSKAFSFESDQKEMTASVQSEEMYGSAETNGADKITISEKDGISAEGNAYSYDMTLSVNNKTCDMVSITGESTKDTNLKLTEDNVEATGVDAASGTITVFSNDLNTDTYTYDKGYSSIMIAPSGSEQTGQIDILGSSNDDGNYDVKIGGSSEKKDLSKAVITVPDQAYTGKPITPEKMVVTLGTIRLQQEKDYRVFYENNMDVGTATVFIIGTGDYIGSAEGTFNIIKAMNPVKITNKAIKVRASKLKNKNLTVSPIKVTGAPAGKTFKAVKWNAKAKKALKLNKKTGKIQIRKGTKRSTFKVRVQVTAKGNESYLVKSKTVTVTIRVR